MWSDIVKYAGEYESAVLTGMDVDGYPFSLRCQPQPDAVGERLFLDLPSWMTLEPGSACLLWHRHDEHLWNLHSFVVRGGLVHEGTGWYLQPAQFIPGVGIGGWRSYVHFLVDGRRTTRRYLQRRGLARPKLNWQEWDDLTNHPR